eukprot:GFYU01037596.1.p1 GENE.GFYU01037596.1~~GFYU01037596.1.p1  ORF type:complete len:288 (-),score=58.38 GFYU01037596.1:226-1089(-)
MPPKKSKSKAKPVKRPQATSKAASGSAGPAAEPVKPTCAAKYNFGILYAEHEELVEMVKEDMRTQITRAGSVICPQSEVNLTFVDVGRAPVGVEDIAAFDSVLVYCNAQLNKGHFHDADALGDVLADYVDGGGGVVVAFWATTVMGQIKGRFAREQYGAIVPGPDVYGGDNVALGNITNTWKQHPLLDNIFYIRLGGDVTNRSSLTLVRGAKAVMKWSDNKVPAVVFREVDGRKPAVALNFLPWSDKVKMGAGLDTPSYYGHSSRPNSQGDRHLFNALRFAGTSAQQ